MCHDDPLVLFKVNIFIIAAEDHTSIVGTFGKSSGCKWKPTTVLSGAAGVGSINNGVCSRSGFDCFAQTYPMRCTDYGAGLARDDQ